MVHSKTPGGQQPSDKFMKQQAEKEGHGADNAPGHTEPQQPLDRPIASDSGESNVGITEINNLSAGKSGAFPGKEGVQNVGSGAPTANVPSEQRENA